MNKINKLEKIFAEKLIEQGFENRRIIITDMTPIGSGYYCVEFIEIDKNRRKVGATKTRYLDGIDKENI